MKNVPETQLFSAEELTISYRRERYLDRLMAPFLTDQTKVDFLKSFGERVQEKFETGLVIGRFQPFHAGHAFLIEQALEVSNNLVICIGSANKNDDTNPFSVKEREIRIRKSMQVLGLSSRIARIVAVD